MSDFIRGVICICNAILIWTLQFGNFNNTIIVYNSALADPWFKWFFTIILGANVIALITASWGK